MQPKRVIILSPYKGDIEGNLKYLRQCMADSAKRGEAPYASHAMYPFFLNDMLPEERAKGFEMEAAWLAVAEMIAVYWDLGVSSGMQNTIHRNSINQSVLPVEYRNILI